MLGQEQQLCLQACASPHSLKLSALVTGTSGRLIPRRAFIYSFPNNWGLGVSAPVEELQSPLQDPRQLAFFPQEVLGLWMSQLAQAHLDGTVEAGAQGGQDTQHPGAAVVLHRVEGWDPRQGLVEDLVAADQHAQVSHRESISAVLPGQWKRKRRLGSGLSHLILKTTLCSKGYCCCDFRYGGKRFRKKSLAQGHRESTG